MSRESMHNKFMAEVKKLGLDINQKDFAAKMDVGEPLISMYMNGKRTVSLPFLKRFCEVYGLNYDAMLKEDSGPDSNKLSDRDLIAMFLRVSDAQTEILRDIRDGMARVDTQAKMDANLDEVRSIVDKLSKVQNKAVELMAKEFRVLRAVQVPTTAKGKRKIGDGAGE
jgi:transcriptional regulator with XRE-family HTH domain